MDRFLLPTSLDKTGVLGHDKDYAVNVPRTLIEYQLGSVTKQSGTAHKTKIGTVLI